MYTSQPLPLLHSLHQEQPIKSLLADPRRPIDAVLGGTKVGHCARIYIHCAFQTIIGSKHPHCPTSLAYSICLLPFFVLGRLGSIGEEGHPMNIYTAGVVGYCDLTPSPLSLKRPHSSPPFTQLLPRTKPPARLPWMRPVSATRVPCRSSGLLLEQHLRCRLQRCHGSVPARLLHVYPYPRGNFRNHHPRSAAAASERRVSKEAATQLKIVSWMPLCCSRSDCCTPRHSWLSASDGAP